MVINRPFLVQVPGGDDDEEFELTIVSYRPQVNASRDDPGEGAEVDFAPFVTRYMFGRRVDELSLDEFMEDYCARTGLSREEATQRIQAEAEEEFMDEGDRWWVLSVI